MKKYLAVFDMDGVVLNSMPHLTEIGVRILSERYSLDILTAQEAYLRTTGLPFLEQLNQLYPGHKAYNLQNAHEYEELHRNMASRFPLSGYIEPVLEELRRDNYLLALVTSTSKTIVHNFLPQVRALRFHYLGGYTPDRDKIAQLQAACGACGVDKTRTIYIGDSDYDAVVAARTEVRFIHATHDSIEKVLQYI